MSPCRVSKAKKARELMLPPLRNLHRLLSGEAGETFIRFFDIPKRPSSSRKTAPPTRTFPTSHKRPSKSKPRPPSPRPSKPPRKPKTPTVTSPHIAHHSISSDSSDSLKKFLARASVTGKPQKSVKPQFSDSSSEEIEFRITPPIISHSIRDHTNSTAIRSGFLESTLPQSVRDALESASSDSEGTPRSRLKLSPPLSFSKPQREKTEKKAERREIQRLKLCDLGIASSDSDVEPQEIQEMKTRSRKSDRIEIVVNNEEEETQSVFIEPRRNSSDFKSIGKKEITPLNANLDSNEQNKRISDRVSEEEEEEEEGGELSDHKVNPPENSRRVSENHSDSASMSDADGHVQVEKSQSNPSLPNINRSKDQVIEEEEEEEEEEEFRTPVQTEPQENKTLISEQKNKSDSASSNAAKRIPPLSDTRTPSKSQHIDHDEEESSGHDLNTSDDVSHFLQRPQHSNGLFAGQSAADIAREFGIALSDSDEDANAIDPRELEDAIRMANTLS